jgi:two-component system response regulator
MALSLTEETMRRRFLSLCCCIPSAIPPFRVSADLIVALNDRVEALEYFLEMGVYAQQCAPRALPQTILPDLKPPEVDGVEVLPKLRANEQTRPRPAVIRTSSDEDQDRIDSYRLGANSYIREPVDFAQFIEAIRQLDLYWLILNLPLPAIRRIA